MDKPKKFTVFRRLGGIVCVDDDIIEDLQSRTLVDINTWSLGHGLSPKQKDDAERILSTYQEVLLDILLSVLDMKGIDLEDRTSGYTVIEKRILVAEFWGWRGYGERFPPRLGPLLVHPDILDNKLVLSAHIEFARIFVVKYGFDKIPAQRGTPPVMTYIETLNALIRLYAQFKGVIELSDDPDNAISSCQITTSPAPVYARYLRSFANSICVTSRTPKRYATVIRQIAAFRAMEDDHPAHTVAQEAMKTVHVMMFKYLEFGRDPFSVKMRNIMHENGDVTDTTESESDDEMRD